MTFSLTAVQRARLDERWLTFSLSSGVRAGFCKSCALQTARDEASVIAKVSCVPLMFTARSLESAS